MGGQYPTNRGIGAAIRPNPDPGWGVVRPGSFPRPRGPRSRNRTFARLPPVEIDVKPSKFGGVKPRVPPFGRRPGIVYPSPFPVAGRLARVLPWAAAGAFLLPFIFAPGRVALDGWKTCFDIGGRQDGWRTSHNACSPVFAGLSGQQYFGMTPPAGVSAAATALFLGTIAGIRMTYKAQFTRGSGVPMVPAPVLLPRVITVPDVWLPFDPNFWPPMVPLPYVPVHPPVRWPGGKRLPAPGTYPPPRVGGNRVPGSSPSTSPGTKDLPKITISPSGVRRTGDRHQRRPPDRWKEKEHKFKPRSPFHALGLALLASASGVYNGITEAVDLISAIYSALPDELIARQPTLAQRDLIPHMLGMIYRHADQIDFNEALTNIATNAIEDAAWGRYFGAVASVSRDGPNYIGFDRELGQLNELFRSLHGS